MRNFLLFFLLFVIISCEQKELISNNLSEGNKYYEEGEELIQKDNIQAYSKFQQAISYYNKQKDSSKVAKSLIYQSIAQNYTGDILGAESSLVEALTYMKEGDKSYYSVFGSLGNIKYDQKEYIEAENWFKKALSENFESYEERANLINNKSAAEYRQGKFVEAKNTLKAIDMAKISDLYLINRIKENAIYINWLENKSHPAEEEFEKLLINKIKEDDLWGANSSYSHLAEINQVKNKEKSLYYAKRMLQNAIIIKSPEDRLEALERILFVDNPIHSTKNFMDYKILADSIQRSRNDDRKSFAYIKYDSEKKEVDNQRLRNDKIEDQNSILRLYIGTAILIVIIIIITVWYRRRQLKLKQEKELEVKNTQLKMSKKVHDVVANGIYQVMTKIENQEFFDKNKALDELEYVYEKSRDISYEKNEIKDKQPFDEKISSLIASFKNDTVNTYIAGNGKNIWGNLPASSKEEVYQIIRELLVNMKKHSHATAVAFKFEKLNNTINIQYTDNGIGISGDLIRKNGLTNTGTRIEAIQGKIIFDSNIEKGLKIYISFPTS